MKYIFKFTLVGLLQFASGFSYAGEIVWCPVGPNGPVKEACRPEKANCEIQDSNRYGCHPFTK